MLIRLQVTYWSIGAATCTRTAWTLEGSNEPDMAPGFCYGLSKAWKHVEAMK